MTMKRWFTPLLPLFVLCGTLVVADEPPLRSGPQVGQNLPGPFNPLNVTNAESPDCAGKRSDYTEQHGANPVALIFAREVSKPLTELVKKLDAEVGRNKSAKLRAVLVLLSEDDAVEQSLKKLAREQQLRNISLALIEPPGPKHFKLSEAADCTIILYRRHRVEANHAFRKGGLTEKGIAAVLADLSKIAPSRE
jgi:hypothetical protein